MWHAARAGNFALNGVCFVYIELRSASQSACSWRAAFSRQHCYHFRRCRRARLTALLCWLLSRCKGQRRSRRSQPPTALTLLPLLQQTAANNCKALASAVNTNALRLATSAWARSSVTRFIAACRAVCALLLRYDFVRLAARLVLASQSLHSVDFSGSTRTPRNDVEISNTSVQLQT